MSEKYETREVAEKAAENINKTDPMQFCPLINGSCDKGCVCFEKATVRGQFKYEDGKHVEKGPFYIIDPHCGNMMFFRECQNG